MEERLYRGYSKQFDTQLKDANEDISKTAVDIVLRVIGIAVHDVTGTTGKDLIPIIHRASELITEMECIPDYEDVLYEKTGLITTVVDVGTENERVFIGTRAEYEAEGWIFEEEENE